MDTLSFENPVTFFVGENGCGKSTLLAAIACGLNCPTIGATDVTQEPMMHPAQELAKWMRFSKEKNPKTKLFFRAEDAIGFTRALHSNMQDLADLESEFESSLRGYGKALAMGAVRRQKSELSRRYGEDPDAKSHGEWFINLMRERIHRPGLYLLDEPETPLSPIHQLTVMSIIKEAVRRGAQFIIATHSPILMAYPNAVIYTMDNIRIQNIRWDDVEHVAITKAFLIDPRAFLRHL